MKRSKKSHSSVFDEAYQMRKIEFPMSVESSDFFFVFNKLIFRFAYQATFRQCIRVIYIADRN